MSLLADYAENDKCRVTVEEHGGNATRATIAVDSITLTCDKHGELASYGMLEYPKYRLAWRKAHSDGAEHLGLDRPTWHMVGLAPTHRDH